MLLTVNKQYEIAKVESLLNLTPKGFNGIEKYYQTSNREFFKEIDSDKKYLGGTPMFPHKSFAFVYLRPLDFLNKQTLMKARTLCTKGIIYEGKHRLEDIDRLFVKFNEVKRANKLHDEIKAHNDEKEEKYKAKRKEAKEKNREIKARNKELQDAWKKGKKELKKGFDETLSGMTEEQKKFMPTEPNYDPEPEYEALISLPEEPSLRDLPHFKSIRIGDNNFEKTLPIAWRILSTFEIITIEGTDFNLLKKREEPLNYSYEALNLLSENGGTGTMSREEFLEFFTKNEKNEKVLENHRPSFSYISDEFLDIFAESAFSNNNAWIYEEETTEEEEEALPSLAPIKPMHAASIFSGGMKFSQEIKTDEGYLLIKSAPVKTFTEKKRIFNGKEITEVYQQQETKLAFYNLSTRSLEMY